MIRLLAHIRRSFRTPGTWVVILSALLAVAANSNHWRNFWQGKTLFANEQSLLTPPHTTQALREGVALPDLIGQFRIVGERIQFVENESGRAYRCLENLMLQRVYQVISEEATPSTWIISGKATEYRTENYLFLEIVRRTQ
jgi:hypothetical protein